MVNGKRKQKNGCRDYYVNKAKKGLSSTSSQSQQRRKLLGDPRKCFEKQTLDLSSSTLTQKMHLCHSFLIIIRIKTYGAQFQTLENHLNDKFQWHNGKKKKSIQKGVLNYKNNITQYDEINTSDIQGRIEGALALQHSKGEKTLRQPLPKV